jgi:excisionase family DNA binding protein
MADKTINLKQGQVLVIQEKPEKEYYSVEEVAEKLSLNYFTVLRHIKNGSLVSEKIGKQYRISQNQLENYIKKQ